LRVGITARNYPPHKKNERNERKVSKKLTAQPHARARSMEVNGYENSVKRVLLLEGGVEPTHSFDYDDAAADLPPIPLSQTLGRMLIGGGG
jgi:hypothetical protein